MRIRRVFAVAVLVLCASAPAFAASTNGSSGEMPAYYDGQLFTINLMMLSSKAEVTQIAHNRSINTIYESDPGLPDNQPFVPVLDAIQADGFNPIWQEVQVVFNSGFTPRQLTSDNEILAAAAAGEVTLIPTTDVYRCSVVGQK
jgi:hypothetical protein